MKTASCTVMLTKGHSVPKRNVTPAEVALYIAEHHVNVGGNPVVNIKEDEKEVSRTNIQERNRLASIFGSAKVKAMFPGGNPTLPEDFAEATEIGLGVALPDQQYANGAPPAAPEGSESPAPSRGFRGDE